MFSIDIDLSDLDRSWRDEAMPILDEGIATAVFAAVDEGAEEARRTHRYQNRTGTLERETKGIHGVSTHGAAEGEIVADTPYASYVDGGTEPHEIVPRNAQALRWEDGEGAHFAKRVQHPGTQPDGFMGRAYQKAERVLEREIENASRRVEEKLNR